MEARESKGVLKSVINEVCRVIRSVAGRRSMRTGLALTIFVGLSILFYARYLFVYTGYPGWGNFLTPLTPSGLGWSIFFNPFQFDSIPSSTPQTAFLTDAFVVGPMWVLYHLTSVSFAGRLYVLGSTAFFMLAGYAVSSQLTRYLSVRVLSVAFLTFNPFMIMILSAGDAVALLAQSFTLIALYLMLRDSRTSMRFPGPGLILSWVFLSLSLFSYQAFFLGILVYSVVFVTFRYRQSARWNSPSRAPIWDVARISGQLLVALGAVAIMILPEIYPLVLGGVSSGTYVAAPDLASLAGNSVTPLRLILLKGYPPNLAWLAVTSTSPTLSIVWSGLEGLLVGSVLLSPFLLRKPRWSVLSIAILSSAALGAAAKSPLYPLTSFLYLRLPGYGSLNASYFWDWFCIVPLYFLLFTLTTDLLVCRFATLDLRANRTFRPTHAKSLRSWPGRSSATWPLPTLALLAVVVLSVPIVSQGYYNSTYGINDVWAQTMPSSYAYIQPELARLMGPSSGGVAYFNPDNNLNFSKNSTSFTDPLVTYPEERTASLTYYGAPQTPSNRFFYWVYGLFYQNQTRYLGQLMSLAGIEYFVVLNGTNSFSYGGGLLPFSEGKNASQLMEYQQDVVPAYVGQGYAIYRNLAYSGTANVVSNLTLVAGGFNELNVLPYFGFNLSTIAPVLSSDLTPAAYSTLIPRTRTIVVPSFNSLYSLVLPSVQNPETLADFATASSPSQGWTSITSLPESTFYLIDSIEPVAIAEGNQTMRVPMSITSSGDYTVWLDTYVSGNPTWRGGALRIQAGNTSMSFDTSGGYEGLTNAFVWRGIQTYLTPGETLSIQSLSGWNAVRNVFVLPSGESQSAFQSFNMSLARQGIQVYQICGGSNLASNETTNGTSYQIDNTESGREAFGQVSFLSSQGPPGDEVTLDVSAHDRASLVIQVLATVGGMFQITYGNSSEMLGFSSQSFINPANATPSYLVIPLNKLIAGRLVVKLVFGFVFMGGIALIPGTIAPSERARILPWVGIANVYEPPGQHVTNFSSSETSNGSVLRISTSFNYNASAPSYVPVVSIALNQTFPYNETMFASGTAGPNAYLFVNTVIIDSTLPTGFYTNPDLYGTSDVQHAPYLYVDVYLQPSLGNVSSGRISFALTLAFFLNQSAYSPGFANQLLRENQVTYSAYGYSVSDCEGLTWVRLPYYDLMQAAPSVARFSIESSVGQMLVVPQAEAVTIRVTYVGEVVLLAAIGSGLGASLFAVGILLSRRDRRKSLSQPPTPETHSPYAEERMHTPGDDP